ncbi:MAG TPA: HD domain-containing phosphohydrolase, partial [Candidatus Baltobacteraceae bacterium]|nr:HD domain-containing phosphohydrolase [Candidatus Baltobacteraceae bacterium]
ERLDGSGYPRGLKGDEILFAARVIAVADVMESMTSHRPYRPARAVAEALQRLADGRGRKFDPRAVDACAALFNGLPQLPTRSRTR